MLSYLQDTIILDDNIIVQIVQIMQINRSRKLLRKCPLSLMRNAFEFHRTDSEFLTCPIYLARDYLHNRYGENSFAGDSIGRNEGEANRLRDLSRSERRAHLVTLPVVRVQ